MSMQERVGFLGGGHMGRALIAALIRDGSSPAQIAVADPVAEVRAALVADFGIRACNDNLELVQHSDILVLAVKPQDMAAVLAPLRAALAQRRPLLISVAAGLAVADLARMVGTDLPIVRSMPNRPALVGAGATGLFAPTTLDGALRQRAERILGAAGAVVWVDDEALIDVVTAVSGSGPAYFFLLAETLVAAAVAQGLPPAAAQQLAAATLYGAGVMAGADSDVAAMRRAVTSKGGTTEAALRSFDAAGFSSIVAAAVEAAVERSRALSHEFGRRN